VRLLLHAITSPEAIVVIRSGLRGQPLVRVDADGLAAWVTEVSATDAGWARADLLEHHDIISHLHERLEATLPSRFPTWSDDESSLRADIEQRRKVLHEALERVRGRSEVALTVVWTSPSEAAGTPDPVSSGASFLRARQRVFAGSDARRERARALAGELQELVGDDLVEIQTSVCPSTAVALSVALLIPSARASEVMAMLPRAQRDVRILVNGPWPPYTFAVVGAG
jgi:hypothetical protein